MRGRALKVVGEAAPERISDKVKRLQAEAKAMAHEHVLSLHGALVELGALADDIAQGGDVYPAGVREIARRLVEECDSRAQAVAALAQRG